MHQTPSYCVDINIALGYFKSLSHAKMTLLTFMGCRTLKWSSHYQAEHNTASKMTAVTKQNKTKKKDGLRRDRDQLLADVLHPHSAYKFPKRFWYRS